MSLIPKDNLILLMAIGCGLYFAAPYLTGEDELLDLSALSMGGEDKKVEGAVITELIVPKIRNKEVSKLVADFKEEFERLFPDPEFYVLGEPTVMVARFNKEGNNFLIDMRMYKVELQSVEGEEKEKYVRGELEKIDVVFKEDEFQRLITDQFDGKIRLYPEIKD